jgi:hypothetical protein
MKSGILVLFLGLGLSAQSLVESSAAAAAGGTAGAVAGKKVSDAITNIFNKVDKTTKSVAASKQGEKGEKQNEPLFEVGPGEPRAKSGEAGSGGSTRPDSVPPPPPVRRASTRRSAPPPETVAVPAPVAPPEPPAPVVTAAELRTVAVGANRDDVLKLGTPAARITMFDDGHLVEIYRYVSGDANVGTVQLSDGAVASVQVH